MTKEEILTRLLPIVQGLKSQWNEEDITLSSNLRTDLGLESLDYIDLVLQAETTFNITITPEESSAAVTVGDFINLISSKLS